MSSYQKSVGDTFSYAFYDWRGCCDQLAVDVGVAVDVSVAVSRLLMWALQSARLILTRAFMAVDVGVAISEVACGN